MNRFSLRAARIYDGIIGAEYFIEIPFTIDIAKKRILVEQVR